MIKVGQIYESKYMERINTVITRKSLAGFNILFQDGSMQKGVGEFYLMTRWKLIAEYPTWQEAVNSPEFTGEKETLGIKLKKLRDEKNLSLQDVSNATHISKSYLWDIEKDNKTMSVKTLSKLAVFYGVSPNYLLGF